MITGKTNDLDVVRGGRGFFLYGWGLFVLGVMVMATDLIGFPRLILLAPACALIATFYGLILSCLVGHCNSVEVRAEGLVVPAGRNRPGCLIPWRNVRDIRVALELNTTKRSISIYYSQSNAAKIRTVCGVKVDVADNFVKTCAKNTLLDVPEKVIGPVLHPLGRFAKKEVARLTIRLILVGIPGLVYWHQSAIVWLEWGMFCAIVGLVAVRAKTSTNKTEIQFNGSGWVRASNPVLLPYRQSAQITFVSERDLSQYAACISTIAALGGDFEQKNPHRN